MRGPRERHRLGTELFRNALAAVAAASKLQTQRLDSVFDFIHAPIVAPRFESVETCNGEHLRKLVQNGSRNEAGLGPR